MITTIYEIIYCIRRGIRVISEIENLKRKVAYEDE